ncbi:hypothetical protein BaRGS_00008808 [Batillaria attramentaria]|uniref:Uncharacterized protein n=1 Tax=Batillaria attramentaria TaxID=370345 RepID=A0ABD0LKI0_9CAEN
MRLAQSAPSDKTVLIRAETPRSGSFVIKPVQTQISIAKDCLTKHHTGADDTLIPVPGADDTLIPVPGADDTLEYRRPLVQG